MSSEMFAAGTTAFRSILELAGVDIDAANAFDEPQASENPFQLVSHITEAEGPLRKLGVDPVGIAGDGKTAIQDAFTENKDGVSKMDKAVDAVADADHMSEKGNKQQKFEEAVDGFRKDPSSFKETTVGEAGLNSKGIIMADGPGPDGKSFNAKYFGEVKLDPDTVVYEKTITYAGADGKQYTETVYIFDDCANPSVDAAPDKPVAEVAPEVPPSKPAVTFRVDPYAVCPTGCVEKALVATIHVPNVDPSSPEYQAAIRDAIPEIQKAQNATGPGFDDDVRVIIQGPDGKPIDALCLKDGESKLSDEWHVYDKNGKSLGKINPQYVESALIGDHDVLGDGRIAPPLDAKLVTNADGAPVLEVSVPEKRIWIEKQVDIMAQDVVSNEKSLEAAQAMANTVGAALEKPVPAGFFDWSFEKQTRYFESQGLSSKAAEDLVTYLREFNGTPDSSEDFVHFPNEARVSVRPGDTFGTYLYRGYAQYYDAMSSRVR